MYAAPRYSEDLDLALELDQGCIRVPGAGAASMAAQPR